MDPDFGKEGAFLPVPRRVKLLGVAVGDAVGACAGALGRGQDVEQAREEQVFARGLCQALILISPSLFRRPRTAQEAAQCSAPRYLWFFHIIESSQNGLGWKRP